MMPESLRIGFNTRLSSANARIRVNTTTVPWLNSAAIIICRAR